MTTQSKIFISNQSDRRETNYLRAGYRKARKLLSVNKFVFVRYIYRIHCLDNI